MTPFHNIHRQNGVMLLEALIAILIFSLGILAIIGMQAMSIQTVSQAKYRTDASFLANEIIGQMWTSDRSALIGTYQYLGGAPPAAVADWAKKVTTSLPGAAKNPPQISIQPSDFAGIGGKSAYNGYIAKITIFWQAPEETSAHRYDSIAYLQWCGNPPASPKNNC